MYPKLSDMLYDLFGVEWSLPIQTFGFFMALGFLAGTIWLQIEFRRKEKNGRFKVTEVDRMFGEPASFASIISNAILGFIVGFKGIFAILNWKAFSDLPQKYLLSADGSLIGGIVCAALFGFWRYYSAEREKLNPPEKRRVKVHPHEHIGDIIVIAAISGVAGAKLLSVFESWSEFIADPIGMLFSFSGLTFYGGLIGAGIVLPFYVKKKGIPFRDMLDAAGPAVMIGYAVGRLGCHFSGDGDWGVVNLLQNPGVPDWFWAYDYPNNVLGRGVPFECPDGRIINRLEQPVWPTSVYEFFLGSGIFAFLVAIRKKIHIPGALFAIYLMLNGLERFLIEFVRINERYAFGLSLSQFIALGLIALGAGLLYYFRGVWIKESA